MVPPTPTKRRAAAAAGDDDAAPPSRRLRLTSTPEDAPGSSNSGPPPPRRRKSFATIVLVVLVSMLPVKGRTTDSLRIGRLEKGLKALRHDLGQVRDTLLHELGQLRLDMGQVHESLLRKQDSIKKSILSKLDNIKGPSPSHHNHEHLTEGTQQEGTNAEVTGLAETETEGKDTSFRLRFGSDMKPRIYHDDEISISIGICDGDNNVIESGPLSKLNIEVLALEGSFPYDSQGSWTSKEFDDHIADGRDGKRNVLAGKGTNAQLIDGKCHLRGIKFREGSCRARSRMYIIGARVCDGQAICGRVQEAVTNPVVVLDRRNKFNEKSYPPKLDDEVHQLENICKKGEYRKKLEKQNIHTVEHFLKALYKDENSLRSSLGIKPKSKVWDKMVAHAQTCCLKDKPELKSYWCAENVVLFFNYVHRLVGARFGSQYIASDNFAQTQKNSVDMLKKNAYGQLDGLTGDHEMRDNIPVPIGMNTDGGAGPSCMTSSAPQQINYGHHIAEHQVGGTPASEVLRPCAPHDPNSIPDPNRTQNYQAGVISTVEGLSHGLNESSFAIGNDGPSTSFYAPYQLTAHKYQDLGTGSAAQPQQQHLAAVDRMTLDSQAFPQHQADNNNWEGAPQSQQGEMMRVWSVDDILQLVDADAASLPNDGTMGLSGSAQQEWSQCQGNMPGNMLH